tara:strand:+ start:28 stop:471 length:444 start_codon:yes stop_codon:yes gene_type:complete
MKLERISELFCTSLGIGYTPFFPGTIASFIILPLVWFIKNEFGLSLFLLLIFFFSILSHYFIKILILNKTEKDPKFIIVDEYIGQSIALIFCNEKISEYLISFLLFRFFDILKPYPIKYFNNMKNASGVILDDIVAGLIVCLFFIFF